MNKKRRTFLKMAGIAAAGSCALSATLAAKALASDDHAGEHVEEPTSSGPYSKAKGRLTARHWGMVIDTRQFETTADYQPLIDACVKAHNIPQIEGPDNVKWIWTDSFEHVFPDQHAHYLPESAETKDFLLLCNHCENPPCVRVCPTKATFKRESDGIVMMDMHRCIGCRFCMAGCPYGARSINLRNPRPYTDITNPDYPTRMRGVVEKCTFCTERLAQGLMPACVEASEGKILFGDLADPDSEVRQALAENYAIRRKTTVGTQPSVYYLI